MENYVYVSKSGADLESGGALMFPGASVIGIAITGPGGLNSIYVEPRDGGKAWEDGTNQHFDKIDLTTPWSEGFDHYEVLERFVQKINAIGPFTVLADLNEDTTAKFGDDNNPALNPGIPEVTVVAITSAD